ININERFGLKLAEYPRKMFGHGPGPDPFRIDQLKVFRSRTAKRLVAEVSGAGFGTDPNDRLVVLVNGSSDYITTRFISPTLLTIGFPIPEDETIKVTLVSKSG